jgi:glycosyltransferase involved in cell wall biosynthesis
MKILFLTKELPYPINNGHRMRSYHYIKGLTGAHEVMIITYDNPALKDTAGAVKHFQALGCRIEQVRENNCRPPSSGAWQRLLALCSVYPYAVKSRVSPAMQTRIRKLAHKEKFDILICDGIHQALNVPADIAGRKALDEHNVESMLIKRFLLTETNLLKKFYAWVEWKKFVRFENRQWPLFDEIHACSQIDQQHIIQRARHANVKVVPNGVDTDKFQPRDVAVRPYRLIYTGLIGWRPNEDAVRYFTRSIYPKIKRHIPEVDFYIVGKNPSDKVKKLADEDPSITVTGFVDDVIPYIAESAVYVVPLRIGSGTRLKILEAMAMGKAVISTSVGCEGIEATPDKDILIEDDPEKFADQTIKLLNDAGLCRKIGGNAARFVRQNYSWDMITDKLKHTMERDR